jgi:hypothetical protein
MWFLERGTSHFESSPNDGNRQILRQPCARQALEAVNGEPTLKIDSLGPSSL